MSQILRCAIVGTGAVAHLHAEAIEAHPNAELAAVTNRTRSRADEFADKWGHPAVHDTLTELLEAEHPDVVLICTSPDAHTAQVLASFAAGAHVIVEKPPAPSLEELDVMRAAAAHVRRLLSSGVLGRPLLAVCQTLWYRDADYFAVPWRGRWETEGGGTTLGHGIHQLDLLAFLLGDWATVQGRLWRLDRETQTEDTSTATVTFADGVVAQVVTSAVAPRQTSSVRIDTQKATITVDHLYGHGHHSWRITPAPGFLPLIKPALITCAIFAFIWAWNDFLGPLIYLTSPENYPLPIALRLYNDQTSTSDYGATVTASFLALVPIMVFFVVFQRFLVDGVATQGLKG